MSPKFGGSSPPEVETFFGTKSKSKQYITNTEFRVNAYVQTNMLIVDKMLLKWC